MKKTFLIFILLIGLSVFFIAHPAWAYSFKDVTGFFTQTATQTGLKQSDFAAVIANVIQAILGIIGIIFIALIIYGGVRWMISEGNEKKVESAKKTVIYAIIGLAIVAGAYVISTFVASAIEKTTTTSTGGGTTQQATRTCASIQQDLDYISHRCVPAEEDCNSNEMRYGGPFIDCPAACCIQTK